MRTPKLFFLRRDSSSATLKARLAFDVLETRVVPYSTTGNAWPQPSLVTLSFVPDGTNLGGASSNLFSTFNAKWSTTAWQNQILRAAQVWAQRSNLNFTVVADSGAPSGSGSYVQGDPTIGDIRIGGYNFGNSTLATGFLPPPANNYSIAGDIEFNTAQVWSVGGTYDLFTVAAHEFGHALGMSHSSVANAIMFGTYNTRKTDLISDDIAGIQSVYGTRIPDRYDTGSGNNTFATATDISSQVSSTSQTALLSNLDLTTTSDVDYFTFTAPAGSAGSFTAKVQSKGLSFLCPSLTVYAADQTTVLGSTSSIDRTGNTLCLTVSSVTAGQRFYVKVAAADSTAFGTGAYALALSFGNGPPPTVSPPNTQTAASGTPQTGGGQPNDTLLPNNVVTQTTLGVTNVVSTLGTNENLVPGPGTMPALISTTPTATVVARADQSAVKESVVRVGSNLSLGATLLVEGVASSNRGYLSRPSVLTTAALHDGTGVSAAYLAVSPIPALSLAVTPGSTGASVVPVGDPVELTPDHRETGDGHDAESDNPDLLQATGLFVLSPSGVVGDMPIAPTVTGADSTVEDAAWCSAAGMVALLGLGRSGLPSLDASRSRRCRELPSADERRRRSRLPCWLNSFCWQLGRPPIDRCQSVAQDVSTAGVRLLLRRPFDEGTVLITELEGAAGEYERRVVARVVHVQETAPGVWEIGCVFDRAVDEESVQELLLGGMRERAAELLPKIEQPLQPE